MFGAVNFYVESDSSETVGFTSFTEAFQFILEGLPGPRGHVFNWSDPDSQNVLFYTGLYAGNLVKVIGIPRVYPETDILQEVLRSTNGEYGTSRFPYYRNLTTVNQTGYGSFVLSPFKESDFGLVAFGGNF